MSVQSMGAMRKDFCPNLRQPFLENIDKRSRNGGSRGRIPAFYNPHRKSRPSPSMVDLTLKYFVGVLSNAATSGREKKQVRIHTQKTHEYLEGGNQVSRCSLSL